jgi:hypothetical protein
MLQAHVIFFQLCRSKGTAGREASSGSELPSVVGPKEDAMRGFLGLQLGAAYLLTDFPLILLGQCAC